VEFWRTSAASPNSDDGVGDMVTVSDGVVVAVTVSDGVVVAVTVSDILGLCEVVIEGLIVIV